MTEHPITRQMIDIGLLDENPLNTNVMNDREFDLLVDNIQSTGVTENLVVRPTGDGRYRIFSGHYRYKASLYLGLEELPCAIITDPDFTEEMEEFQLIRMNMIHGSQDPQKFMDLYQKYAGKYGDDMLQDLFGFADDNEFRKLITQAAKTLPKDMQKKFKEAAKEVKTIDGLAKLLNHLFCHDEQTEYLSRTGWKKISEFEGEAVAAFDSELRSIVWDEKPILHTFEVEDEPLFYVRGKSTDMAVTRGHRMFVSVSRGGWGVRKIEDIADKTDWRSVTRVEPDTTGEPLTGFNLSFGHVPYEDMLRFIGWFVTEGHFHSRGTALVITQKSPEHIPTLFDLHSSFGDAGCPVWGPYVQSDGTHKFYFAHAGLKEFVLSFCGSGSENKALPDWALTLPYNQTAVLFEAMMSGDGHWREEGYGSYYSNSRVLIDQFQMIAVRMGFKATMYPQGDGWSVTVTSGCGTATHGKHNTTVDLYTGKVWCFETCTGFFVTRRNGRVAYHGNTKYGDTVPYGYMVFDSGSEQNYWLRMSKKTYTALGLIGDLCIEQSVTMDDVLGGLIQSVAKGDLPEQISALVEAAPKVEMPEGMVLSPTKDHLEQQKSVKEG